MNSYYAQKLSAERLQHVYALASPEVRKYLQAEIDFLNLRLPSGGRVLELGCGYGRVLQEVAKPGRHLFGIDTALANLQMARRFLSEVPTCRLTLMDAGNLAFAPASFDAVFCIQNGISAFRIEPKTLLKQALQVTRPGGRVLFSSYAEAFWEPRLQWFQEQAKAGLLGEIDLQASTDGVIVTRDGFRSGTATPEQFRLWSQDLGHSRQLEEVEGSSVFLEIQP
ncbi:MAG: class I SAM-dependent methyltransferase [Planctomycetota bacterium]|nr:MAG: class I SAM-dependent methyltransferase [Planctomycetota bacterium]